MTPKYAKLASWSVRAAVCAGLAGVVAELAGARSLLVTVLVLVFIAVAPAAAIAGLLRGFDLFARLILAYVTAVVAVTLIAMIMLAAGIWSPRAGLVAIVLVSGGCLVARRAGSLRARLAARATLVRRSLVDYWVTDVSERPAGQVAAASPTMTEADSESRVLAAEAGQPARLRDSA